MSRFWFWLAQDCRLTDDEAAQLWDAISIAKDPRVAVWRQAVLAFDASPLDAPPTATEFREESAAPARLLAVLEAVLGLERAHTQQDLLLRKLPKQVYERLQFPDLTSFRQRLIARMPAGMGAGVLAMAKLTHAQWAQVLDIDGGLKPLPQRPIERFHAERKVMHG
jgi:hypothetical protein